MTATGVEGFAGHLLRGNHVAREAGGAVSEQQRDGQGALRKLWEQTDLPASEFADEVAQFFSLPRVALPQLLSGSALVKQFSRRFLREMTVFPYRGAQGQLRLAVADPSDSACARAAQIVLGAPVAIEVASFEDIATALTKRMGDEEEAASPGIGDAALGRADDDIDSLRDLASGAPVVRAVNDLLEKAVELRASDIHIEPFRTGQPMQSDFPMV